MSLQYCAGRGQGKYTMNFFTRMRQGLLILLAMCGSAMAADPPLEIRWRSGAAQTIASDSAQNATKITELVPNRGTRHIVVQFTEPVSTAKRAQLATAGVTLLDYLGDNAFFAVVSSEGVTASKIAEQTSLTAVAAVETPWKMHSSFVQGPAPVWGAVGVDKLGSPIIGAYVLFHPDVALRPKGARVVEAYGATVRDQIQSVNGLVIEIALSQVAALAAEDVVEYIEPALPPMDELNAENRVLTGADLVQTTPYSLDGTGIKVLVYDAGKATNATGAIHPDMAGRMTIADASPWSDHAAHVACTVGGDGSQSVGGIHRGMAPGADIVSYGFQSDSTNVFLYSNPGDLEADYTQAITTHGADLANNSIGTNACSNGFPCTITGDYGVTSALIDNIVRGSLGSPFRVLWANGNERACAACPLEHQAGYHSTAPPSCAKNHITVGAVNSNDDSMTSFSSWGPCDDGRLKPDISAPGCQVGGDLGVTSCNTAFGIFGYSVKCGTSMATPTVTGLSALLLQDFRTVFPTQSDFTNATLKILLAHNAVDIGNTGPDFQSGYGSVRIQPTIDFMRSGAFLEDQVAQGAITSILMVVDPGDPQLKVTLAWDDVAGTPLVNPALVNDLDLRVFDSSNVQFFPWTLDPAIPALPAVQTQADHLNNIEQIVIDTPVPGVYRVEVLGFNVPQGPQAFSLAGTPQLLLPNSGTLAPASAIIPTATQHTLTAMFLESVAPFDPIPLNTTVTFEVLSGPSVGILGTALTNVNGEATLSYTGANGAGIDQIQATFNDGGTLRVSNIATATWVAGTITLAPTSGSSTQCTGLTLTADAIQGAPPFAGISGATVTFDVIAGPNAGVTGTGVTDANGTATFFYAGNNVGLDTIEASFIDAGVTQTSNSVTHNWTASTLDCNLNNTPDQCEIGWGQDCNANGTDDLCDLAPVIGFGATVSYLANPNPTSIVAGDLDGMPGIDLALGTGGVLNEVSVFLNDGTGTLAPAVAYTIDKSAAGIVMADFDGVSGQDLAVATSNDTVSVLLNTGSGTFAPMANYFTLGNTPTSIATGDLDGINGPDLVVANKRDDGVNFFVTVMLNSGSGTFPASANYFVRDFPDHVAVGDLDGVNGPDIVTSNRVDNTISVLLNNGNGTFATQLLTGVGNNPSSVTPADFDGDGDLDVAITQGDNTVRILKNNGTGTLIFASTIPVGIAPSSATATDIDSDGDLDLIVTNAGTVTVPGTTISVLINKSNGDFAPQQVFDTFTDSPEAVTAADFNGNGDPGIAVAHNVATNNLSVLSDSITFVSLDCNANFIPDDCEPDADGDVVPDACDLCPGTFGGTPVDATGCPLSITCSSAGTIVLDAAIYTCSDAAAMQVVDCDLNLSAIAIDTVNVTLASTSEAGGETVTLTETAIDSAIFEGSIPLSTTNGVGILLIGSGDLLTATYTDVSDGLGGTNLVRTDTATIPGDCLDVTVELEAVSSAISRTVTIVVTDCTGPVTETFTPTIDFDASGLGSTTLTLSTPGADWISADEDHTLRTLLSLGAPLPASIAFTGADRLMAGDFSGDGLCDIEDLSVLASNFMTPGDAADATGEGVQDTADFTAILVNFFLVSDAVDGCP